MAAKARAETGALTQNQSAGEFTFSAARSQGTQILRRRMHRSRWTMIFLGTLIAGAANAAPATNAEVVRDLAIRVGPIIGSALACRDIARPRIQTIVDKFVAVIREAAPSETAR